MTLREICIMFKAQYIYKEGVRYLVPEGWKESYGKDITNSINDN